MTHRLLLSMVLGLITSTGIALIIPLAVSLDGAGATETIGRSTPQLADWPLWQTVRRSRPGLVRIHSMWLDRDAGGVGGVGFSADGPRPFVPAWADFANPLELRPTAEAHAAIAMASGWPFHCLGGGAASSSSAPAITTHSSLCFGATPSANWQLFDEERTGTLRLIPWFPLWPGLLGDWLLYGTAWWIAVSLVASARRRWRTRRGLCASCGYPASGGIRCPECGLSRASS